MDAVGLAAELRGGVRTAIEVRESVIRRIEALDPAINAVVIPFFDGEWERAQVGPPPPFAGVPILLKDLGACLQGMPLYQGNQLLRRLDWRAAEDGPLARRLVAAGFTILGKTNTPEFGAGVDTQPRSFGPTRNPWDRDHSVSGSSGGAAAAVASGMIPIAHGNDFGGSIRAPAAWCGVIGLKPSRGRVSTGAPPGANTEFVLTRSLRDAAAVLDAVADAPGPGGLGRPVAGWLVDHALPPGRLRLGLVSAVAGVDVEQDASARATAAAAVLADAGHVVVDLGDRFLVDDEWDRMQLRVRANGARARVDALAALAGRAVDEHDVEPLMLALAALAPSYTEAEHAEAGAWQLAFADRLHRRWEDAGVDAVITPTTGVAPQRLVEMAPPPDDPVRIYDTYRRIGCFLGCWNMTGHAAISLPWWSPTTDRLPRGVQLVTAPGREDLLLRLARQLCELEPERTAVRTPTEA